MMWKDVYGKYNIVGNTYFSGMKIIHHISFSAKLETKTVAFSRSWIKFGLLCSRVERKPTESKISNQVMHIAFQKKIYA